MIHDEKKVTYDADKAEVFEKVFFQGGNFRDKCVDDFLFNDTVSLVNVALNIFRNNLEQSSINDFCYDMSRKVTINDSVAAIRGVDSGKGADPYGLTPRLMKLFKFLTLS